MRLKRSVAGALAALAVATVLTGCSTTTPEAMCGFVINNTTAKLVDVLLPGETDDDTTNETIRYVPCNERNYKINDGTERRNTGNGEKQVGDRLYPSKAYTKNGTPVLVWSDSYWMLNQNEPPLKTFYSVCYKYTCYSESNSSGAANFSTDGWNGMLAENFSPTIDDIARQAVGQMDDSVFSSNNSAQRQQVGEQMSALFAPSMQKKFGSSEDLFCGSGNSKWTGEGDARKFECTQVRIDIPRIERYVPTSNEAASNPESQAKLNAERLKTARELYGDQAPYWLGVQDSIEKCKGSSTPCQVYVGAAPGTK